MVTISRKVGRPFSENPKDIRLTIRLDKEHYEILEEYSNTNEISKNEAVRKGIRELKKKD
ncbi:hypothetical protein AN1V17_06630 [Vallitalea sediminicola]